MPETELVLRLLAEGGGATIYRVPVSGGEARFFAESGGIDMDQNDDEVWRYGRSEFFATLEDTLHSIFADGTWVTLSPFEVNPEFGREVWELAERTAEKLSEEQRARWERKKRIWRKRCRVD